MNDFRHNWIKQKYAQQHSKHSKTTLTDTDNLTYEIETVANRFDNSDYPENTPYFDKRNKEVIGILKDEAGGIPSNEFVGLRSEMYS